MHDARNPSSSWTVPLATRIEVPSEDVEIGAVQIDMNLKDAGRGRIATDSGAAKPVLPKNILPNELIVVGEVKRPGAKYVAVSGGKKDNMRGLERHDLLLLRHGREQAVLDNGNAVIYSRNVSCVLNEASGGENPIVEETDTFGIDVEFLELHFVQQG